MPSGKERRRSARFKVGGNAQITTVLGRGREPKDRARVVNWSRGGLRLKVPSPSRRFLFQALDPVLFPHDTVFCTLRVPPQYKDIEIQAKVVHVERGKKDNEHIVVGLRFDENTETRSLEALAKILEPKPRSQRLQRVSGRGSARVIRPSSRRRKKTSQRAAAQSSRRQQAVEE